ncbi:TetR/AcrR family transcriptional regulator [Kitasatospora sp. NPDC057692]|uniref:TetR/AcrR family transcriptional regulator n=1 Tax=Kitasatospora sp. NPDC057692 TaxID=3346215 RepID=UPI00368899F9
MGAVVGSNVQRPGAAKESGAVETRRRGAVLEKAIFDAVFEELRNVGYGKLSMDGVANRARTGKAGLYRRWSSKETLVLDALRNVLPIPGELPAEGNVRDDVLMLLRCMQTALNSAHGAVLPEAAADVEGGCARTVRDCVIQPCREMLLQALERGVDQGGVRAEAVTPMIVGLGPSMLIGRVVTDGVPIPDAYVVSLVDDVLMPLIRP